MHPAKAGGRHHTLEAPHRPDPLFDSSMVLLQMIIQVTVRAMAYLCPQLSFDSSEIPVTINRPIQIRPAAFHFNVGLVRIPTRANSAKGRRPSTGPEKRSAPRAAPRLCGGGASRGRPPARSLRDRSCL